MSTDPLPTDKRVTCPYCKKALKLRKDGKLPVHEERPGILHKRGPTCMLSECPP